MFWNSCAEHSIRSFWAGYFWYCFYKRPCSTQSSRTIDLCFFINLVLFASLFCKADEKYWNNQALSDRVEWGRLIVKKERHSIWKKRRTMVGNTIWTWPWWRHQMETFSALLAICVRNSRVTWINGWVNNAGDCRRQGAHYDVIVMWRNKATLFGRNDGPW